MVTKEWVLECHCCANIWESLTFNGLCEYHSVYKKKSINPLADELAGFRRMPKYLGFCNEDCAEKYFNEIEPKDKPFYKRVKPRKNGK